jgi:hypothetical protein
MTDLHNILSNAQCVSATFFGNDMALSHSLHVYIYMVSRIAQSVKRLATDWAIRRDRISSPC